MKRRRLVIRREEFGASQFKEDQAELSITTLPESANLLTGTKLKKNDYKILFNPKMGGIECGLKEGGHDSTSQGLVKGVKLCLNPYFFGWPEK